MSTKRIFKHLPSASDLCRAAIIERATVDIVYNDTAGVWQWSIQIDDDSGLWLWSFDTEQEAVDFCNAYQLPIGEVLL